MRIKSILLSATISMLAMGCSTAPIQINENTTIPQIFEEVLYRSTLEKPGFFVMTDKGTLTINNDSLEFIGDKENLLINYTDVKSISFGKLGSDIFNNWIVVDYGEQNPPSYAVMTAGKSLGWSGGSDNIFSMIKHAINKNNFTSVEIKE